MKTLLIMRHGKAERDGASGDHSRELNERGQRDSETMGAYIAEKIGLPDAILTSDAQRALQTAEIASVAMGYTGDLTIVPQIYDAELITLLALSRSLLDEVDTALVVGHNPGFEEVAAALAGMDEDDVLLPTAGLAHLTFNVDKWDDVRRGSAIWHGIVTPKTVRQAVEDASDEE